MKQALLVLLSFSLIFSTDSQAKSKLEKLLQSYEAKVQKNPENLKARKKLIVLYQHKKNYVKIIETAEAYIDELPADTLFIVADAYGQVKNFKSQIKTLKVILQSQLEDFLPNYLIGLAYKNDGNTNDAIIHLRKSIHLNPKHKQSFENLLQVLTDKKDHYEARIVLNDIHKNFGESGQSQSQLCELYYKDAFYQQAIDSCKKSISLDDKLSKSYILLAKSNFETKNETEAKKIYLIASGKFPKNAEVQYEVGDYYFSLKNYPTAIRYYTKSIQAESNNSLSHLKAAEAYFATSKFKEALEHYVKSCQLKKSNEAYTAFRNSASKLGQDIRSKWSKKYLEKVYLCE